jgi:hypothetical protein
LHIGLPEDFLANERFDAVSADEQFALPDVTVGEADGDMIRCLLEIDRFGANVEAIGTQFQKAVRQCPVKIGAMHRQVGEAVQSLVFGSERDRLEDFSAVEKPEAVFGRAGRDRDDLIQDAQCAEHAAGIRAELNARADLAQGRRLFEQFDIEALLQHGGSERNTAQSRAYDHRLA